MKIYVSETGLLYREEDGYWEFWCNDNWEPSEAANPEYCGHKEWLDGLKLVGNNYMVK